MEHDGTTAGVASATRAPEASREWVNDVLARAWDSIATPMMVVGEGLVVLVANPGGLEALARNGLAVGDPMGPLTGETVRSDGSPMTETTRPLRRALDGEAVREEEYVVAGSPPQRFVVSAYPFTGPAGERLVLSSWRDVTARWQAEAARQETLSQLHQLMAGAADYAIVMLDAHGHILTWSPSARRLLRHEESAAIGQHVRLFFLEADRAAGVPEAILDEARAVGRAVTEGRRLRRDGTVFWARGVVTVQRDPSGRVTGFVKVIHDVTDEYVAKQEVIELNRELRRLNRELEGRIAERTAALELQADALAAANQELEAFSYSVSHDLRAPLRSMAGFARILADDHAERLDDDGRHYLDRIQVAAVQMADLIEGMLAFARLQRQQLAEDTLDMTALARAAWDAAAPDRPAEELELHALPAAQGDRQLIAQVWINLLQNAVKFTGRAERRRIRVWAEDDGAAVAYLVADNGAGFDPAHAERLFTPFTRLHRAEDFPGTGVGLALVQRILRRHGGTITAEGRPGEGATFRFTVGGPR